MRPILLGAAFAVLAPLNAVPAPGAPAQSGDSPAKLGELARELLSTLNDPYSAGPVAIVDLGDNSMTNYQPGVGFAVASLLATEFARRPGLTLVERLHLKSVLSELNLQNGALIDPKTAARLGKLVGARALVVGDVIEMRDAVAVTARLVSVETGVVLSGATVTVGKASFEQFLRRPPQFGDWAAKDHEWFERRLGQKVGELMEGNVYPYVALPTLLADPASYLGKTVVMAGLVGEARVGHTDVFWLTGRTDGPGANPGIKMDSVESPRDAAVQTLRAAMGRSVAAVKVVLVTLAEETSGLPEHVQREEQLRFAFAKNYLKIAGAAEVGRPPMGYDLRDFTPYAP